MALGRFDLKYRPQSLDDIVLPKRIKEIFEGQELDDSYLFHSGPPGMGKTSLCKILTQDKSCLEIAASDDGGIDTLRNKVSNFISTGSIMGGSYQTKVVFFDEIDGASKRFYEAFRTIAEQNVIYIATCNNVQALPDAVRSRFKEVNFLPENKEEEKEVFLGYMKRVSKIGKMNGITFDTDVLKAFVKQSFPDMRTMMHVLQDLVKRKKTKPTLKDINKAIYKFDDVFEACLSKDLDEIKVYKEFSKKYANFANDVVESLWTSFIKWCLQNERKEIDGKVGLIVREVAEHKKNIKIIDPVLNMLSCIYVVNEIINE